MANPFETEQPDAHRDAVGNVYYIDPATRERLKGLGSGATKYAVDNQPEGQGSDRSNVARQSIQHARELIENAPKEPGKVPSAIVEIPPAPPYIPRNP